MSYKKPDTKSFYKFNPKKREYYKQKEKEMIAALEETKHSEFNSVRSLDKGEIVKKLRETQKTLERANPDVAEGKDKDRQYKRAKELEEFILNGMPTKDEMMGKQRRNINNSLYQEAQPSAIDKQVAWVKRTGEAVREYKNIMRQLEPDDPNACNLEILRRHARQY